jgi:hypothetical protein
MKKAKVIAFEGQLGNEQYPLCYKCPLFSITYDNNEDQVTECGIPDIITDDAPNTPENCPFNSYETIVIRRVNLKRKNPLEPLSPKALRAFKKITGKQIQSLLNEGKEVRDALELILSRIPI